MQTIYLDVLLLQSLYVNYFLLRAAARVTHTPLRFARCLLVSAGSSLFSLLIFLPALPLLLQLLLKLTAAAATVSLAFGIQHGRWLGQFGCFFGCSFLLAGLQHRKPGLCHMEQQLLLSGFFPVSADPIHGTCLSPAAPMRFFSRKEASHRRTFSGSDPARRENGSSGGHGGYRQQPHRSFLRPSRHCLRETVSGSTSKRQFRGTAARIPAASLHHSDRKRTSAPVSAG